MLARPTVHTIRPKHRTAQAMACVAVLAAAIGYTPGARSQTLRTLHAFSVETDGGLPTTDLSLNDGALIGTTSEGGSHNGGTLFKFILADQTYAVLHDFGKPPRGGMFPCAHPVLDGGIYYGTTYDGGATQLNGGTAFGISATTGKMIFQTIFRGAGGYKPAGGLSGGGRYLYGTTADGDMHDGGNVFRLDTTTRQISVLHAFQDPAGGTHPYARLLKLGRLLYGTTQQGGKAGAGTIFTVDSVTGASRVIYNFQGGIDGTGPSSGLILSQGMLYGTTTTGGSANLGTVYRVDPGTGAKTILHSFTGGSGDGATPLAAPTVQGNVLYGTASEFGGLGTYGAIYKIDLSTGKETIEYSFTGNQDGAKPTGRLLYDRGVFYGTTIDGGAGAEGTLFAWRP